MTEQNRKYITKEIGKLLSGIWLIKGLAEQEFGPQHPITEKLGSMHRDAQALLQEKSESHNIRSTITATLLSIHDLFCGIIQSPAARDSPARSSTSAIMAAKSTAR